MKKKKLYYRRLDVIRDVSCIMVLLYHLNILPGGFLAVCTFFTLSGYLACMSALEKEKFSIKTYYISRIKTLYLPLIVVVFTTVIFAKIIPNITWLNLKQETISALFGYNNFWQINANLDYFTKNVNSPFIHLWYISILMQFELIFPVALVALKKIKEKGINNISIIVTFLLTIVATILFFYMSVTKDRMVVYYNTFARIFSIFFGIMLALIHYEYGIKFPKIFRTNHSLIFGLYMFIFIILNIFVSAESKYFAIFMILTTIISTRMIKYSIIQTKISSKLDDFTELFAKLTYEIYLVQYPIIFFMQKVPINRIFKTFIIIILTFIIAFILHLILNYKPKKKSFKNIKDMTLGIIIVLGSFLVLTEKDHTAEMKELEESLNVNADVIEKKNEEFVNLENTEYEKENEVTEKENKESEVTEKENKESENNPTVEQTRTITEVDEEKIAKQVSNLPVVGIGDSVLLGAIDELYKKFPNGYFDGKVSRNLSAGETILRDLKSQGKLSNTIILALANNGDYSTKKNKELMEIIGDRQLYWVNAVGADDPTFNAKFKEFAKDYSNIHIVEWDVASKNHPEYFYADGIHTKNEGMKKYAETIYKAVYEDYLKR